MTIKHYAKQQMGQKKKGGEWDLESDGLGF